MLSARVYIKEEMDDFSIQGAILDDSLNSLSLINKFLGNTSLILKAVKNELINQQKPLHIVDLGCGGGDNLRAIADWCSKNNRVVKLTGIDGNSNILAYAKQQKTAVEIYYKQADVLDAQFELEQCDILISSHFIYRFTDIQLVDFIEKSKQKVNTTIIFSELQRNIIPFYLFKLFGGLLSFNKMVVQDGLKAIQSSFKKDELRSILKKLSVKSYELKWKWAFRYLIVIKL